MANTFSDFTNSVEQVIDASIPILAPALPDCGLYSRHFRLGGVVCAGKVQLPIVSSVQAVQSNPSSFENSEDVIDSAEMTLELLSAQWGLTADVVNNGMTAFQVQLSSHVTNVQKSIQERLNAQINTTNFGSPALTVSSAAFAVSDYETAHTSVPARTIIALTSAYHSKVKTTWTGPGDGGIVRELSHTTGIGSNVSGFVARPEALGVVYGFPQPGPAREVKTRIINLPIGLPVQLSTWYQRSGRAARFSLDITLAVVTGQAAALKLITSE